MRNSDELHVILYGLFLVISILALFCFIIFICMTPHFILAYIISMFFPWIDMSITQIVFVLIVFISVLKYLIK